MPQSRDMLVGDGIGQKLEISEQKAPQEGSDVADPAQKYAL